MGLIQRFIKDQRGFSLVEIAIVLVILGLLIGGVLKGQELLESARLNSILAQVNQYQLATATFMDRYGALPGDYDKASENIHPKLQNGKGNGIIDGVGLGGGARGATDETVSFWTHLAAANLIPSPGEPHPTLDFNKGLPASRMGGGFTVEYQPLPNTSGHWLILGKKSGSRNTGALLTPQQAFSIMNKGDSPDPRSGKIRAEDGQNAPRNGCVKANGQLNMLQKSPTCVLYFQL